jgi:hypothetical protein
MYAGTPDMATTSATGGMVQAGLGIAVMAIAAIVLVVAFGVRP